MIKYVFYDTDATGIKEYDIDGEHYKELIDVCFKYCDYVSFKVLCNAPYIDKLSKYKIEKPANIECEKNISNAYNEIRFYRTCPELKETMLEISDSIFKWLHGWGYANPEDPVFYRKDGTVFFDSEIHEGACWLIPKDTEDIENVLAKGIWSTQKEHNDPFETFYEFVYTMIHSDRILFKYNNEEYSLNRDPLEPRDPEKYNLYLTNKSSNEKVKFEILFNDYSKLGEHYLDNEKIRNISNRFEIIYRRL